MMNKYNTNVYGGNPEQAAFWEMLQEALDNNGNPFTISVRNQYGTVNKYSPNSNLCLGFDFLLQKRFFRIGIYIQDDTFTHYFEKLLEQKDEIEDQLGFAPIWTTHGAKNPNTRRIETQLPFIPYDRNDYERLIDEALPIFMQYIKVFTKYLPEAFENNQIYGGKQTMSVIIGNSFPDEGGIGTKTTKKEVTVRKYKRQFKTGDTFQGKNYVDMLNKALGTNYQSYIKCSVPLTNIGGTDKGIAWFVYMNNTIHGYGGYLWRNKLSLDGNTIKEQYVGNDKNFDRFYLKSDERLRLAFQIDPAGSGNCYKCEFVGLFLFSEYDEENMIRIYKKIDDTYTLW